MVCYYTYIMHDKSRFSHLINPLTPGTFYKKCFFLTFWSFLDWISAKLSSRRCVYNTTACPSCHQHCVLAHCDSSMRRNQNFEIPSFLMRKWPTSLGFSIFGIFFFFLSFFSFSLHFAAVIDLLLGLLAVKKLPRKRHRDGQFLAWSSQV